MNDEEYESWLEDITDELDSLPPEDSIYGDQAYEGQGGYQSAHSPRSRFMMKEYYNSSGEYEDD